MGVGHGGKDMEYGTCGYGEMNMENVDMRTWDMVMGIWNMGIWGHEDMGIWDCDTGHGHTHGQTRSHT